MIRCGTFCPRGKPKEMLSKDLALGFLDIVVSNTEAALVLPSHKLVQPEAPPKEVSLYKDLCFTNSAYISVLQPLRRGLTVTGLSEFYRCI
jgi:hypothetical protein